MSMVNFYPLQEQMELLLSGGCLTTKYLICLRNSGENLEDKAKKVHLGVI
jgi:hypothetical protein